MSRCRFADVEAITGEPLHFKTTRTYLAEWLENSKADTAPSTHPKYEQFIRSFVTHLGVKADRLLREVTANDVRLWRDALKAKGLSAVTVYQHIKTLRIPFRVAADTGIIDINPNTKSSLRLLKDDARNVVKDIFEPSQIAKLIAAAPSSDWAGMITLAYVSGLRLRDCSDLMWSNVDLTSERSRSRLAKQARMSPSPFIQISHTG